MSSDLDRDRLSALWQRQFPKGPPIAHELRTAYGDRTVPELPPERHKVHPQGTRWTTLAYDDDPDSELHSCTHLYADRRPWRPGTVDSILREVADDVLSGVIITDSGLGRIHHPYDGGADVIATSSAERDRMRDSHQDRLPRNPAGL